MKAITIVYLISLITVFIAAFSIFFIFDKIQKTMKVCDFTQLLTICKELFDSAGDALAIIVIIGGLLTIIPAVAYLMLSAQRI